jgi:hypothetical protein
MRSLGCHATYQLPWIVSDNLEPFPAQAECRHMFAAAQAQMAIVQVAHPAPVCMENS